MNNQQVKDSFVARIWLENGDNGDAKWRGHIRHVQGEEEGYFQNLAEMHDFLSRVSGVPGLPLASPQTTDATNSTNGTVTNLIQKD
ncbi:MAG: hypothetical protein ABGY96_30745 [bacterium]|nr:hypothetical protein [Gammaproteobacteria bacterium]HIL98269.1 hypothetical protein [Pseudomonadales bacterium]